MALKITNIKDVVSVLDTINDTDDFTVGLFTGFLNQEDTTDSIYDVLGLIDSDFFTETNLSEDDQRKYRHNPSLLSYNLYGTTDYAMTILFINGLGHPGELDVSLPIKLLSKTNIEILSNLYKDILKKR